LNEITWALAIFVPYIVEPSPKKCFAEAKTPLILPF
jgi:hypothetical protein